MWVQYNVWKLLFKVISMRSNFFISCFGTPRAVCFITSCDLKASERDPILCRLNKNFCIIELRNISAVLTLGESESGITNFLVAKTTSLWPYCILMCLLQICKVCQICTFGDDQNKTSSFANLLVLGNPRPSTASFLVHIGHSQGRVPHFTVWVKCYVL